MSASPNLTEVSDYLRAIAHAPPDIAAPTDRPSPTPSHTPPGHRHYYTIVRATQFHEFTETITATMTGKGEVRVPDALIQPIAADAAAAGVVRIAVTGPINGIVNVGGPDKLAFAEMAALVLAARGEDTPVVVDSSATYFGTRLQKTSLVTGADAVMAGPRFADWLAAD